MRTLPAALAATLLFAADSMGATPMIGHVTRVHNSYSVDPSRLPVDLADFGEFGLTAFQPRGPGPFRNSGIGAAEPLLEARELAAVDSDGSSTSGRIREPILLLVLGAGLLGLGGIARRRLIKSRSLKHPSSSPPASVITGAP